MGVQEITLQARTYGNPFADVTVQGRFCSQGKEVTVDGFYDGGHTWRVRFMPDTAEHGLSQRYWPIRN